jgi:hypothetical protein
MISQRVGRYLERQGWLVRDIENSYLQLGVALTFKKNLTTQELRIPAKLNTDSGEAERWIFPGIDRFVFYSKCSSSVNISPVLFML